MDELEQAQSNTRNQNRANSNNTRRGEHQSYIVGRLGNVGEGGDRHDCGGLSFFFQRGETSKDEIMFERG